MHPPKFLGSHRVTGTFPVTVLTFMAALAAWLFWARGFAGRKCLLLASLGGFLRLVAIFLRPTHLSFQRSSGHPVPPPWSKSEETALCICGPPRKQKKKKAGHGRDGQRHLRTFARNLLRALSQNLAHAPRCTCCVTFRETKESGWNLMLGGSYIGIR